MKSLELRLFLTFILAIFSASENLAVAKDILVQKNMKRNLRWDINVPKDSVVIDKKRNSVFIKSISPSSFNSLRDEILKLKLDNQYMNNVEVHMPDNKKGVPSIELKLAGNYIEIFSFYRERQNKFILDFWINEEKVIPDNKKTKIITKSFKKRRPKRTIASIPKKKKEKIKVPAKKFRDFRYGASFIWDYKGLSLSPPKKADLSRRTPDYYYPILDRPKIANDKDAHLQLSINLYRKNKFGLMKKSIDLYRKKYGPDSEVDFNEYLEANAFLRINLKESEHESTKYALNMLESVYKRTKKYPLKRGILKYMTDYYLDKKDYINGAVIAKQLYYFSKKYSDVEVTRYAAKILLHMASNWGTKSQLKKFMEDSEFKNFYSAQEIMAVRTHSLLKIGDTTKVITFYEKNKRSLIDPVHEGIIFNVAESYFREGKFNQAIKMFKKFIKFYSFHKLASKARVRIALSHELLEKNPDITLKLYKEAIDHSAEYEPSIEARIRYVALRTVRKLKLNEDDLETRAFLKVHNLKSKLLTQNLKTLLWLTRLRTFIVDKNYQRALSYLEAIPLEILKPSEKRVFMADGAEITNGLIRKYFKGEEYRKLIILYEKHKEDYQNNAAPDPLMSYFVGKALVKLGFYDLFDQIYERFKGFENKPKRTFPLWIDRAKYFNPEKLLLDLRITKNLKLKNNIAAKKLITEYAKKYPSDNKINYFRGLWDYQDKKYMKTIKFMEKFLSKETDGRGHTGEELANILKAYTDSLYKKGFYSKFKKVSKALLKDTKKSATENVELSAVKEWIRYINIELLAKDKKLLELEMVVDSFLKDYKKSTYIERIKYVLGIAYVEGKNFDKGKEIFKSLVDGENTTNYIKELARSEISLINIRNKTL